MTKLVCSLTQEFWVIDFFFRWTRILYKCYLIKSSNSKLKTYTFQKYKIIVIFIYKRFFLCFYIDYMVLISYNFDTEQFTCMCELIITKHQTLVYKIYKNISLCKNNYTLKILHAELLISIWIIRCFEKN